MKTRKQTFPTFILVTAVCAAAAQSLTAQETPRDASPAIPDRWDVTAAHGPSRQIEFETSEGTWMNVDVSPDGRTVVFDLLGDIYTMPLTGGRATLVLGGRAYETMPRFSPDGRRIAFTSDRDGIENIWTMDLTGGDLRQITRERERQMSNPVWTPDGQYIVARKHLRNTRSLGSGEMWLYHVGGGSGLRLTDRRNWEQNATEPAVSPDGRYIYFSEDVSPGGGFQYNLNPHGVIYAVQRLDRDTGRRETFLGAPGGSLAPRPSPDGGTLAFIRRIDTKSVLMLHDIATGRERRLWDGLDHDQQEVWAIFGTYPGYAWTPDGRGIVIWAQGGLWNVDVTSGAPTRIPFTATVRQTLSEAVRFPQQVAPDQFDVRLLRWVGVSPDQRRVAYTALGKLYVKDLPGGTPRRVTTGGDDRELYPAWSPDGQSLVYATWNDSSYGAIRTSRVDGRSPRTLTTAPGHYVEPRFSDDGSHVVYRRIGGDGFRGTLHSRDRGIYIVAATGGAARLVTEEGSEPRFNRAGDRLFLNAAEGGRAALISVNLNGGDRRVHVAAENGAQFAPSPDERYVAWIERFNAWVAPLPLTGRPVDLAMGSAEYPVRRISRDAGSWLHWSGDGARIFWALGPELFQRDIAHTFAFAADDTATLRREPEAAGTHIGFRANTDRPDGVIALVGATVITMRGDEVIPNATVIVDRNRITAVGPAASVTVPAGAHRIDVAGRWIMPGIVDVHAHAGMGSSGITPRSHWPLLANLAFGVTTMHDPSNNTDMVFSVSELVRAGTMTGPRLFSTGTILYGAEGPAKAITTSYADALTHLRRMQAVGAFSVKSYNQPRRDARQQIVEAARELGMMVVPEGGSTFFFNITHILDGHTGVEHNIPVAPVYEDVLRLWSESRVGYTPTLIVNYGGLNGEFFFYQHDEVWKNERLRRFVPAQILDPRARRRLMAAQEDYSYIETSRAAKALLDRGVRVLLGAHGQLQGLGAHWELWMFQQGGMSNHEALRAATLHGAEYLGLDNDIGAITPGRLADLLVLDASPLADIRNSTSIRYVMVNGRIYDADSLASSATTRRPRRPASGDRPPGRGQRLMAPAHPAIDTTKIVYILAP
jgi:Tol biopolymer transport system component/imidazolonepropionase-like amidohydrolase